MSPVQISLTADDFEKRPRGPQLSDSWLAKAPLETPLGAFRIELDESPDSELLDCVSELATFVSNEYDAILNVVYESYQEAAAENDWLRGCGVPRRLSEIQVKRYLQSRVIFARRDRQRQIVGSIFIGPQWDEEHGIHFGVVGGRIVPRPP
jgi:hypothetical protein